MTARILLGMSLSALVAAATVATGANSVLGDVTVPGEQQQVQTAQAHTRDGASAADSQTLLWSMLGLVYALVRSLVTFATFTVPSLVFRVVHWTFVFTFDFRLTFINVAMLLAVSGFAVSFWVSHKMKRYTELREPPLVKDEGYDLHPDLTNDQPPSFHNYLDEFLSAIKIFGYLEKPVFHELARHLQTRRLVAGDTLNLESDKSFYIVVDGSVQVYAHTGSTPRSAQPTATPAGGSIAGTYDDEDNNGYQLLNNVESGGTLSSLFTILSLFTEDVRLRYEEDPTEGSSRSRSRSTSAVGGMDRNADIPDLNLERPLGAAAAGKPLRVTSPRGRMARSRQTSSAGVRRRPASATMQGSEASFSDGFSDASTIIRDASETEQEMSSASDDEDSDQGPSRAFSPSPGGNNLADSFRLSSISNEEPRTKNSSPGSGPHQRETTIARAANDATLAVIPAEAFRRLTKKFPNAAAHIVQVILTRLQRVTFLTAHEYLGLTREVVRAEKAINELANYPLPDSFWAGGGVNRLRQRFVPDTSSAVDGDSSQFDYTALDPPTPYQPGGMGRPVTSSRDGPRSTGGVKLEMRSQQPPRTVRSRTDLHSMSVPRSPLSISPEGSPANSPRGRRPTGFPIQSSLHQPKDDFDLREEVMDCISKAIGLSQPNISPAHSLEASPAVRPTESLQRAVFNSSFGSLSFLGSQTQTFDDDSSMTASSALSMTSNDLENEVEILYFPQGSTLIKAGERNSGLYFVIEGFLDVSMPPGSGGIRMSSNTAPTRTEPVTPSSKKPQTPHASATADPFSSRTEGEKSEHLFTVKPGGVAGYLSSLSGFPSYVDIKAKTEVYVGFLPAKALDRIMHRKPIVLLTLAKRLISLLSPLVLHIDSSLDWMHVSAGQVIYREGDTSDSFYIVINGRLRSIMEKEGGGVNILNEHGLGESVGELDCITASPRPTTLHAIRDSELVRMPMTLFNAISVRHPLVTIQISRIIASRVREQLNTQQRVPLPLTDPSLNEMGKNNFNLKTIAIVPVTRHVPVTEFANKLLAALESIGAPTSYLNQATILAMLGRHAFSKMGTLKLAGWLAENEQKYRIVLYVCDTAVSAPWTQTCIRQADCILLVADAGTEPQLGEYEKLLLGLKTTARKELVLLHSERYVVPGSTRPWIKRRPFVHAHHHVQMESATPEPPRVGDDTGVVSIAALRKIKETVEIQIGKYRKTTMLPQPQRPLAMSDFARLARRLCGRSVGLVLGGGGARGISHIGVIRALLDRGIPIDMIGGTSIGALVGGLYAREADLVSTYGRTKRFSGRIATLWRILTDLTYPVVSYTTGHEFNRGIYKSFYDVQIEDLWLPFFCNTTNITHSRQDFHTAGYVWRYVRASMSLAGLLPPLCENGDMLVDGGYVDNLPVSFMLGMGASSVFAVDVGSIDDRSARDFGEAVSGWWVLLNRWNPWSNARTVPSMTEVQSRLTYVSSVRTLEQAMTTPGVLYMRMPVTDYGTLDFKRFEEILGKGDAGAREMLDKFAAEGRLPKGLEKLSTNGTPIKKRGQSIRRNSI